MSEQNVWRSILAAVAETLDEGQKLSDRVTIQVGDVAFAVQVPEELKDSDD